jgi:hypothetical protein
VIISVDPDELLATSGVLRGCSSEAADIGSQLWSCVGCQMPGEIRGLVDQVVAAADRALDEAGVQLSLWSTDLANRAQIARTDSLTAASMAGAPVSTSVTGTVAGGSAGLIGGGFASSGVTVLDPAGGPFLPSAGLIGGGWATRGVTVLDNGLGLGSSAGLISGGHWNPTFAQLVGAGILDNPTTPFLGGSGSDGGHQSYSEWANDLDIDSDGDGDFNGRDNNVRDGSRG